jgi:hypothetical protein
MKPGIIACVVMGLSLPALAQGQNSPNQPETAPSHQGAPKDHEAGRLADPLAGHRVEVAPERATLVERDFQGNLRHPEPTAVEAAVAKLKLAGDERERVDKVLLDRSRLLETFVEGNLDLLTRFSGFENSTDGKAKFFLAIEAYEKLAPLRERGPLDAQLRRAMSPDNAAKFDRLLHEYWNALVQEDHKEPKPKGRIGIVADAKFKDLGKEIEAAYHRSERSGGVLFGYLFKSMTLTDDQSKRLHELCANYSMGGLDNKDKTTQTTFFLAVTQVLEPDQRKVFVKRLKGK